MWPIFKQNLHGHSLEKLPNFAYNIQHPKYLPSAFRKCISYVIAFIPPSPVLCGHCVKVLYLADLADGL